jgi:hypothetical protein
MLDTTSVRRQGGLGNNRLDVVLAVLIDMWCDHNYPQVIAASISWICETAVYRGGGDRDATDCFFLLRIISQGLLPIGRGGEADLI